jgi:hypothetical protein
MLKLQKKKKLLSLILKPYPVLFNRFVKGLMARQNHKGLKESP